MRNWKLLKKVLFVKQTLVWAYLWGIERINAIKTSFNIYLFEPTYEELKGIAYTFCILKLCSLSLPMRNWKLLKIITILIIFLVWAYLWGIESIKPCRIAPTRLFVWAYLWGIESTTLFVLQRLEFLGLSLPMRNWKLYNLLLTSYPHRGLSLPMRNWKSLIKASACSSGLGLSLPMRNWKAFNNS